MGRRVKVKCITTGETFNSIAEAAQYAGVDDWTMSVKMAGFGYFVDSKGYKYVRETPMKTKNTYVIGKTAGLDRFFIKKKTRKKVDEPGLPMELPMPLTGIEEPVTKTCPDIVKRACAEQIKQMLKEKGVWGEVVAMMDYLDIDHFEIRK